MAASAPTPPPAVGNPNRVVQMPRRRRMRLWPWITGFLLLVCAAVVICVRIAVDRAEPILRTRVIETLRTRFKSRVELATLHVSVMNGLQVSGGGLQIYGGADPNPSEPGVQPLIEISEFRFQAPVRDLFLVPMRIHTVYVSGLTLNIPPKEHRQEMRSMRHRGKISIAVTEFVCQDTRLVINTLRPGRAPLEFDISDLKMKDIGPALPFRFDATLVNPKPVGGIHSTGQFGPLNEESPRDTAVEGNYSFTNADLGTLKGIAGILSSTGGYGGTLGRIEVAGKTDTPDFRVAVSGHSVALHTNFHVPAAHFTNEKVQNKIDAFSLRGQGKAKLAKQPSPDDVTSDLQGTFKLNDGVLSFSSLHFLVPGAHADMTGEYSLDGNTFDFHGKLKLDAKLSQTVTGWKSILLKPVDPFFSKNGAGTELPFKITGTHSEPHFGLDFGHKEQNKTETHSAPAGAR